MGVSPGPSLTTEALTKRLDGLYTRLLRFAPMYHGEISGQMKDSTKACPSYQRS